MAALTVSVGSGPITLVQNGTVPFFVAFGGTGSPIPATLPLPSTAGSCLIAVLSCMSGGTPNIASGPAGWTRLAAQGEGVQSGIEVWCLLNNPGGIQSVNFINGALIGTPIWYVHVSEWLGIVSASVLDASGTTTATAGTTLTPTTTGSVPTIGDLAIVGWAQRATVTAAATFTTPPGFTRLVDTGSDATTDSHIDLEYVVNPAALTPLAPILTSSRTTMSAAGFVICLKAAHAAVDLSSYVKYESVNSKLNTLDFALMLGGRLLLESSTLDGYLLEDGSGVLLLDMLPPSLGDPVVMANPTWSGRVVSVGREDIVDRLTNYQLVTVAATNSAVASATPVAPGDLSDVPAGGYLTLEDASGKYRLEDDSGYLELEGTSYGYRHLSVRTQQNQEGTTSTYGTLETFEPGYAAGQIFLLTSANLGYSAQSFTITNVTTSFVGANPPTPVYMVEFGDAYQTLQQAGGGVLTRQGSEAARLPGVVMPGGVLGVAPVTADQGTFTGLTDITGLAVTVTVDTGRRIRLTAQLSLSSSTAGDTGILWLAEGATQLQAFTTALQLAGNSYGAIVTTYLTPTAGVHTYKVQAQRGAGAGNITAIMRPTLPGYILAEDIGA